MQNKFTKIFCESREEHTLANGVKITHWKMITEHSRGRWREKKAGT